MKLHRFIGPFDLGAKTLEITDRELINQMERVLRMKPGEVVALADGEGREAEAVIKGISKGRIEVELDRARPTPEPERKVTLYQSVLKKENFELVVEKAVETGISRIVPVISARTIKTKLNMERLRKIAKEAAEQSGRGVVPEISEIMEFEQAFRDAEENSVNVFFHTGAEDFDRFTESVNKAGIWIGPEGGWTDEEVELVKQNPKFALGGLGKLVLRGETAAVVAAYIAVHENS